MADVILIGTSSLAREAVNVVRAASTLDPIGFLDDSPERWGTLVAGLPVLGGLDSAAEHPDALLLICVTAGTTRSRLAARLREFDVDDDRYATAVHPSVELPRGCRVSPGSLLFAGVVMTSDVSIGRHVMVLPNVSFSHGNRVQSFATIGAGVAVGAGARIGEEATVGMNASIRDRVRVGRRATLAMGSALFRDLPPGETWLGVPAAPVLVEETTETVAPATPEHHHV
ncbi:acetyltransferase [Subtercola lobariae]|uniref:Transferase n=1 Tax=Subtercola lobariae TaxID=1588641 RepID=A0A917B171_9MICO|nr:acetyltransferase [Subtercola lobariae]GGF13910.1 transferase [Subtercola lobariae]